jgi:hypothetical protein
MAVLEEGATGQAAVSAGDRAAEPTVAEPAAT